MNRIPIAAVLALAIVAPAEERFEARYVEGEELVHAQQDSSGLDVEEVSLNGEVLSNEVLEQMGFPRPSEHNQRTIRFRDTVVEATDGHPVRVRRTFDELRKHVVDQDGDHDETGALEGRSLIASEGETTAELEGDGEPVDEVYLEDHSALRYVDDILPEEPVEVGESWQPDEARLRRIIGIDGSPAYFESDVENRDKNFNRALDEGCTVRGEAEFSEVVERDGVRCAVIAFEVGVDASVDDPEALDFTQGPEGMTGSVRIESVSRGKLWYALAEGRPVAMELDLRGGMEMRIGVPTGKDESPSLQFLVKASVTGDFASTWTASR
jgi:hypothetical protein